jgi:hypothetical protein
MSFVNLFLFNFSDTGQHDNCSYNTRGRNEQSSKWNENVCLRLQIVQKLLCILDQEPTRHWNVQISVSVIRLATSFQWILTQMNVFWL